MKDAKKKKSSKIKKHMNRERMGYHAQHLHGSALVPVHIYFGFQLDVFLRFLNVQMSL